MNILKIEINKAESDSIKSGERSVLFRPVTDEWRDALVGKHYSAIHLECKETGDLLNREWRLIAKELLLGQDIFVIDVGKGKIEDNAD